jgi:branched-chain amino acid transport system permease protein
MTMHARGQEAADFVVRSHSFKIWEAAPWLACVFVWFAMPAYLPFAAQIVIMILFTLSYDIVVGYAGIVILGHSAFFGVGAYAAGLLAAGGWREPISGLLCAGGAAAIVGLAAGSVILRTRGLTLLMLGLALTLLFGEMANRFAGITGGHDGLQGIEISPIFGRFEFDVFGRVAFVYCAGTLFLAWLFVRALVNSPFGRSLVGIRLNPVRMEAIGAPVVKRKLIAFTVSAALAGIAGGLSAQVSQFVSLSVFGLDLAGAVLIMLVVGGRGRLYGAFVGAASYMIVQDALAKDDPVFWLFWIGLILIGIVLFAPGGLIGLIAKVWSKFGRARSTASAIPPSGNIECETGR